MKRTNSLKPIIILLLFCPLFLVAQNSKTLSLSLGLNDFTMLDRQASPVVYNLNAPISKLGYQHQNTKRNLAVDLYFSLGQLKASDETLPILERDLGLS
ncbi:MAG: hypothetical protein AAFP82_09820, partial [Bacteroidota bacterium]